MLPFSHTHAGRYYVYCSTDALSHVLIPVTNNTKLQSAQSMQAVDGKIKSNLEWPNRELISLGRVNNIY